MNEYKKAVARVEMPIECETRIRAMLTLGKKREKFPVGRKVLRTTAAAAAAALLLIGGTLAVSGGWNDLMDIFRARNGENYTETQIAQLTELEGNIGLSAESGGITVTVDSVLTTENTADVLLAVQGAGLDVREGRNYSFYNFKYDMESDVSKYFGFYPRNIRCDCVGVKVDTAYVLFHYEQTADPNETLQSGECVLTLTLEDFYEYGESRGDEIQRYEGKWVFELPLKEISEEKVVILRNVDLVGWHREETMAERENCLCLTDEVVIGARSVILRYHREMSSETVHFDIQAVMKDGTVVSAGDGGGYGVEGDYTIGMQWEELIDPGLIEYLLVGGEVIPLPEE